jgi:hypothetical protein
MDGRRRATTSPRQRGEVLCRGNHGWMRRRRSMRTRMVSACMALDGVRQAPMERTRSGASRGRPDRRGGWRGGSGAGCRGDARAVERHGSGYRRRRRTSITHATEGHTRKDPRAMTKPKTGTRAEWLGAAASFLGMGVVMMVARRLPSVVPRLRCYRQPGARSAARRMRRAPRAFGCCAVPREATGVVESPTLERISN